MRPCVTIQTNTEAGADPQTIALHDGESAVFGTCACGACAVDLPIVPQESSWVAGEVTAETGHWLLSNLTRSRAILVENLENSYEYLTVAPGRRRVPIAFELARVSAADSPGEPRLTVFGPEPRLVAATLKPCRASRRHRPSIDPNTTYFSVLRALCGPRLKGSPAQRLPTSEEIAVGLRAQRLNLTARAVDAHIEYIGDKLGLRRGMRRDVLVATAIRRGLVRDG